ncbi:MAG: phosphoglycerate kinase, partial [Anaerolineae bacterium]|nr:phosphoglycerate kinase [Anaerolineae bacterium]
LLEKEITYLSNTIESPERPFVAILGGAKVSDKIQVIEALLSKVDKLVIGGGMANTFLAAKGVDMAASLVEADAVDTAKALLTKGGGKLIIPVDGVAADSFDNNAQTQVYSVEDGVPAGWQSLDIGPATIAKFKEELADAKTVVWNGPMGVFEMSNFAKGTNAIAELLAELTAKGATTIIGGGDSAAAVEQANLADKMTHISTGGGASLELLEGKPLPGLVALTDK